MESNLESNHYSVAKMLFSGLKGRKFKSRYGENVNHLDCDTIFHTKTVVFDGSPAALREEESGYINEDPDKTR